MKVSEFQKYGRRDVAGVGVKSIYQDLRKTRSTRKKLTDARRVGKNMKWGKLRATFEKNFIFNTVIV